MQLPISRKVLLTVKYEYDTYIKWELWIMDRKFILTTIAHLLSHTDVWFHYLGNLKGKKEYLPTKKHHVNAYKDQRCLIRYQTVFPFPSSNPLQRFLSLLHTVRFAFVRDTRQDSLTDVQMHRSKIKSRANFALTLDHSFCGCERINCWLIPETVK